VVKANEARVTRWCGPVVAALALAGTLGVPSAGADISETIFTIEATNDSGTGTYSVLFTEGAWNGDTYSWSLAEPVELLDGGDIHVATLTDATLEVVLTSVPHIDLTVDVLAGTSNTSFWVDSALVDFSPIPAEESAGRFSARCRIQDPGANPDGAMFMSLYAPEGALRSYYNGVAPDGSVFRHAVSVVMASGDGEGFGGEDYPSSGYAPIGEEVYDASVHAGFILTANDRAIGTMSFGLVPEPGGLMLLALGGIWLVQRRRA
jgi:hypothetical protein